MDKAGTSQGHRLIGGQKRNKSIVWLDDGMMVVLFTDGGVEESHSVQPHERW